MSQGTFFDVGLFLNNVEDPDPLDGVVIDLVGYSLYLAYDPTKVEFVNDKDDGVIKPVLSSLTTIDIPPADPVAAVALGAALGFGEPGLTGLSLLLSTITFKATGVGSAGITFFFADPSFGFNPTFFTSGDCGPFVDCVLPVELFSPGTITIESAAPVPEPGTMGLLGLGLLGLARRLKSKRPPLTRRVP